MHIKSTWLPTLAWCIDVLDLNIFYFTTIGYQLCNCYPLLWVDSSIHVSQYKQYQIDWHFYRLHTWYDVRELTGLWLSLQEWCPIERLRIDRVHVWNLMVIKYNAMYDFTYTTEQQYRPAIINKGLLIFSYGLPIHWSVFRFLGIEIRNLAQPILNGLPPRFWWRFSAIFEFFSQNVIIIVFSSIQCVRMLVSILSVCLIRFLCIMRPGIRIRAIAYSLNYLIFHKCELSHGTSFGRIMTVLGINVSAILRKLLVRSI